MSNKDELIEGKIWVDEGHYDVGELLDFVWRLHEDIIYEKNFEIKSLKRKLDYTKKEE
jgi:hypothetical protein